MLLNGSQWRERARELLGCLGEVAFTLGVSNAALVFAVFVYLVVTEAATFSVSLAWDVIVDNVKPAEILVYILALVAPALWIMVKNWRGRRHAGWFWVLFFLQAFIIVGSAFIFGASKAGVMRNETFVEKWALASLITAIVIWYATLAYDRIVLSRAQERLNEPVEQNGGQAIAQGLGRLIK